MPERDTWGNMKNTDRNKGKEHKPQGKFILDVSKHKAYYLILIFVKFQEILPPTLSPVILL